MKYRMKIAVAVIIFLSVAFGIGGTLLIAVSFSNNLRQEERTAVDSYQTVLNMLSVVNSVSPQAYYGNIVDVLEQLEDNGGGNWDGLALTADESVVYASSDVTQYIRDIHSSEQADQFLLMIFSEENNNFLQVSGSLEAGEMTLYLDSIYDITSIYDSRDAQQTIYRYIFVVIVAVGAVLSIVLATFLTRPMDELSRTAKQISGGDLSERAQVSGEDEIGMLADNFNQMADELEQYIDQLKDAMDRQEEFMGDFAHELKTPMTSIIGYADLLRSQTLPEEERQEAANYIFTEGKRLENLSLKLLDLLVTRNEHPEFTLSSPKKLVSDTAELMRPALEERGITLRQDCEEGTCMLEPTLVTSLLVNLIDNARKAMDHGGEITVSARLTDEGCLLTVQDQGIGIPKEEMDKITEAFYRVDKSRSRSMGGVGLGLSLCREIAEVHGGSITFEQVEPEGTRVCVELKGGAGQ
ncbi:MAG: HAMP domain-containing protein [Lachnospiraceae bacterium]|nr:HAMP domain-containing protein [Lachnospiraceae bacterium]